MSDFIVSARKYRPATFETVVGQQHITNTLKNAILNKQLAHAFLFCGPRGVGKTTCARILAKTINCQNLQASGEACDQCDSCESFRNGQSFNIVELDAASNNSVDNIRDLIDNIRFAPQLGKYKIYIIDEVHMLSSSAFNAFLKTLEEPPPHAIFILATTDKHKILPTILSRCQIFDFNRIKVEDIAHHLAYIANNEHVNAEQDALHMIAQKADGGLRDACSMFDQIVTYSGNNITYQNVIENLNILDYDYYFSITEALLQNNIAKAFVIFDTILSKGFDGHLFINGLASHFRNLLVTKDESTLQLLEVANIIKQKYKEQCGKASMMFLINGMNVCARTDFQYKGSKNQRLLVELTLMQIANTEAFAAEKKNDIAEQAQPAVAKVNAAPMPPPSSNTAPAAPSASPIKVETPSSAATVSADALPANTETSAPAAPVSEVKKIQPKIVTTGIASFLNKKVVADSDGASKLSDGPTENFTNEQLQTAWTTFAARFEKSSTMNVTLTTRQPSADGHKITYLIENAAQQVQLNEIMQDLLAFIRTELKNIHTSVDFIINRSETERIPYTNKEKFEVMAKKNPAVLYLKQKFEGEL
jgi:DNA polymerase-3 subunit gamma/tau